MKFAIRRGRIAGAAATVLPSDMERLHDPSSNAYGRMEHVYSSHKVGVITPKISDNKWMAIGSVIAETMLETILDARDDALKKREWVKRTTVMNRIAKEVSSAVEVSCRLLLPPLLLFAPSKKTNLRPRSRKDAILPFSPHPHPPSPRACFRVRIHHLPSTRKPSARRPIAARWGLQLWAALHPLQPPCIPPRPPAALT